MHIFFVNTGIYDRIIEGREFNKEKAFNIFLEELEKKEIEVLKYGEVFPLKIEMGKSEVLDFGDFSLLTDLSKYKIDYKTNFTIILRRSLESQDFGTSFIKFLAEDIIVHGETPFSLQLFILNLYFEKPIYIPKWYEKHTNLLSPQYQPRLNYLEHTQSIRNRYEDALQEYVEKKYPGEWAEIFVDEIPDWEKWDEWDKLKLEEEEEFINSGKAPINYLKETEIEKFKEFVNKIRDFLKSETYKNHKYLRIATHYFLSAHEAPDIADNLVNYVIALEALYFDKETSEMRERLANRIANLLGKNSEEKTEIRKRMLKIYKDRCDYVHGKSADINKDFSSQQNWLRNILRLSLLSFFSLSKYYDSNKKREELLNSLDSVFDSNLIENIQLQASDFLSLARAYDFIHKVDNNDVIEYW
ncbi:MAG: HEPN domain-containing protein [Candidatus Omnitrophica bacterium]|nr:HEPN domain-containing protein [Candidatus Omnitrophota bacterium]